MTDTHVLPAGFEDLAPLAQQWARPSENARSDVRWGASSEAFAAFYTAFMPRLDAVLAYLLAFPPTGMPDEARSLFDLTCAFAEAAPHHELYGGSARVPNSFDARRFVPAHGNATD
jgi:hypothetical protein